jgi:glycine/D-amino acid oxidase-like deaminating enzyme
MYDQSNKKVLVIGGGIGGLAAAIALRQAGLEAVVYESSNALREIGAGLTLWRNAVRAIEKLGLSNDLAAIGMRMKEGGVRSWRGDVLSTTFVDRNDNLDMDVQATVVHRAELLAMLSAALDQGLTQGGFLGQRRKGVGESWGARATQASPPFPSSAPAPTDTGVPAPFRENLLVKVDQGVVHLQAKCVGFKQDDCCS